MGFARSRRSWKIALAFLITASIVILPTTEAEANGGPEIVVLGGPGAISDAVVDYLSLCTTANVSRVAGGDRYSTAAAFAKWAGFPAGGTVFISTGENFPDALAAGPRASDETGPILLTRPTSLPGSTAAALASLSPIKTVILGGTSAVSNSVEAQLRAGPYGTVERVSGANRYATAASVAKSSMLAGTTVYVATGENFPDALAGSHAAAKKDAPILLVTKDSVPTPTQNALKARSPQAIVILGGEGVVSPAVAAELQTYAPSVRRLAGANRFGTAAAISKDTYPAGAAKIYIATGENYPDALAAGAVVGPFTDGPILLASKFALPGETAREISRFSGVPCAPFNAQQGDFAYQLTGFGDDVVAATTPGDMPSLIRFEYDGSSNFIVWALDSSFGNIDLLVNEIGFYRGARSVNSDNFFWADKMRFLEIKATGSWTANVMSLSLARLLTSSLSGATDDVVRVSKGGIANFSYSGSSNFIVWAYGNGDADLLVNEIGAYSGNVLIPSSTEFLDIVGQDGNWTITYK